MKPTGRSKKMLITDHCKSRIESRLQGIVTVREVQECTEGMQPEIGETWVLVKKLTEHKSIAANTPDKWVNGDTVWAVVKRRHEHDVGAVVTILLRRWEQGMKDGTNSP
jgi:hypothetical protein